MSFTTRTTPLVLLLAGLCSAQSQQADCKNRGEYEQVLDAYFAHARGNEPSEVVLRVYGGLAPEREFVIDPSRSTHQLFVYAPRKSIWGDAYDGLYSGTHRGVAAYTARATRVPFTVKQFEVSEPQLSQLLVEGRSIDPSICEHLPLRDSKGNQQLIEDAPWFELIRDGGQTVTRVTDTSDFKDIVSQNPALVKWALEIQSVARSTHWV